MTGTLGLTWKHNFGNGLFPLYPPYPQAEVPPVLDRQRPLGKPE